MKSEKKLVFLRRTPEKTRGILIYMPRAYNRDSTVFSFAPLLLCKLWFSSCSYSWKATRNHLKPTVFVTFSQTYPLIRHRIKLCIKLNEVRKKTCFPKASVWKNAGNYNIKAAADTPIYQSQLDCHKNVNWTLNISLRFISCTKKGNLSLIFAFYAQWYSWPILSYYTPAHPPASTSVVRANVSG